MYIYIDFVQVKALMMGFYLIILEYTSNRPMRDLQVTHVCATNVQIIPTFFINFLLSNKHVCLDESCARTKEGESSMGA